MVAISDSRGGVFNSRGIDPLKAMRYKERSGTVVGMPGTSRISNDDLLTMKCDILVPAALENVITLNNVDQIKAKIVAEAANGPTTPHADEVLARKGIMLLPDILANAGGVTVSYFEWVQDLQSFFWPEAEVNREARIRDAARVSRSARNRCASIARTCAPARTFSPWAAWRTRRWSADSSRNFSRTATARDFRNRTAVFALAERLFLRASKQRAYIFICRRARADGCRRHLCLARRARRS